MSSEEVEVFRGAAVFGRRELIESILREEEVPYVIRSEGGIAEHPLTVGPMGEFILFVPEEHAARARALLAAIDDSGPLESEENDEAEQAGGVLSRVRREPSAQAKKRYLWASLACLAAGVLLLIRYPSAAAVFGALLLVMGGLMLAASR